MSNQDFDPSYVPDPTNVIALAQRSAIGNVATSVEDDPDKAARAMDLAEATGQHPSVVYNDLEEHELQFKAKLSSDLIKNNPHLQDYVNSHPLAAKVSNDDYAQLDQVSESLQKYVGAPGVGYVPEEPNSVLKAGVKGFLENADFGGLGEEHQKLADMLASNPVFANIFVRQGALASADLLEGTNRIAGGVIGGASAMIGEAYKQAGGNEAQAARLTRDLITLAQVGLSGQAGLHGIVAPEVHAMVQEAAQVGKTISPYVLAGKEPPVGIHPVLDEFKAEQAKLDADNLGEALKESVKSATRERSPELFANYIRGITDGSIGISADAVRALYGDKVPSPDDGILGFVPDLAAQLSRAEATGGDINVSVADWLAKVEPDVAKELGDHVRARPEGLTVEEAKNLEPPQGTPTEPVDTVRQAAGLQGIQERKLTLQRMPADLPSLEPTADQLASGDKAHGFTILDSKGQDQGFMYIAEEKGGKRLFVDDVQANQGVQSLGPKAMRDILEQIKEQFPNAETLEGMRVSGAREKANKENVKAAVDLTKIKPRAKPVQLELDVTRLEDKEAFEKASAIGMTVDQYKRYQRLIERRAAEDAEKAESRAMADQRKRQTEEWKSNRAELRPRVKTDLEARADVELDEMLREGRVKLSREGLTDDQIALLPKDYISTDGIHPQDLAGLFGDTDHRGLVDRVIALAQGRDAAGMKPEAYLRRLVDVETDRQMEAKYGNLESNILDEAKDQVLSQTQEDLLHEEVLARASEAGLEYSIKQGDLKAAIKDFFDRQLVRDVDSDKSLAESGRAARAAEMALLKGDYAEAFRQKQRQYNAIVMANYAKRFEKAQASLKKTAKYEASRVVAGQTQDYTNLIHDALNRVGLPIKRSLQDLQTEMEKSPLGYKDMPTFVKSKTADTFGMWESPIVDFLLNPAWKKKLEDLTTAEFVDFKDSVDALRHLGREDKKIVAQGEAADRAEVLTKMKGQLQTFPLKTYGPNETRTGRVLSLPKSFFAGSTSTETLLNRWDRNNPHGLFNRYLNYPLAEAANYEARLDREMAAPYRVLGKIKDPEKRIENPPFNDPYTKTKDNPEGKPYSSFTRRNGLAILHNYGNKENWRVMTGGYGVEPEILKQWLFRNFPDKADWDRAQSLGKNIFDPLFEQAQTNYRNINGVAPAKIVLDSIETPFGEMDGWYHPLIKDPLREGSSKAQRGGGVYDDNDYGHASIANGYTKSRTGAVYPLSLDLDAIPARMKQMIHDIAFRSTVIEAEKIFNDTSFRAEVAKHYGDRYRDGLMPYLRGIAGARSINSRGMAEATRVSNYLRSNIIGSLIGYNPYTALKHGPTALYLSMKEVGPINFWRSFAELNAKAGDITEHNKDFVDSNSEEVQRRQRHWDETLGGVHKDIYGEGTAREKVLQGGSWLVAQSDMLSVRATWLAAYEKEMSRMAEIGEDNHGLAVAIGNRAVRRAHGSTAITNLPALVRGAGPLESWMTTLYGFFGTMMQRRIEIAHLANDTYHLVKEGELIKAAGNLPSIANNFFTYVVVPTAIEEWVSGLTTDDRRGLGHHILDASLGGLASSVLYVRDIIHGLVTGQEPSVGLISTPLHDLKNLGVDFSKGKRIMSKENAGKTVGDTLTVFGEATGLMPKIIARAAEFSINKALGREHPKTLSDWRQGFTRGTTNRPVVK